MHATSTPRVKICCISSLAEARAAIDAGAAALGLVSAMPSGPGVIDEPLIARLAAATPPPVAAFLLTSRSTPAEIIDQQRRLGAGVLQLCDDLPPGAHGELRTALPGIRLVQVIHVRDESSIAAAVRVAPLVDALLLDSGNQQLAVKELGGTGRRHDWALSRRIREAVDVPLFLAGGLNCGNVREAIETVGPWGLDVCSGVRTGGQLDVAKLESFFAAVRG
ncbi:MAG TPA: phosphoribosylanthranilate isomerase [Lacipirellulaceae bacterium]|nr:phosphoribosylanthranilate isomerase [Lacipirellulaceae bacterium]